MADENNPVEAQEEQKRQSSNHRQLPKLPILKNF
jgi:hypothetical protein